MSCLTRQASANIFQEIVFVEVSLPEPAPFIRLEYYTMNYQSSAFFWAFFILFSPLAEAQGLFMPREIQRAYEHGTRSPDGQPGPGYWQNHARYDIEARLDPAEKTLFGTETVTYINNSPDELFQLVVRLKYDVYKKGAARDESLDVENITEGVALEDLVVDGRTVDLDDRRQARRRGTELYINLSAPLASGDSLELSLSWNLRIPFLGIRTGAYDSTSFFMGYWYPQIAVYDDLQGWDTNSYTGQVETYNGLADYDVRISVPSHYLVHATGLLQNPEAVLPADPLAGFRQAQETDEVQTLIDAETASAGFEMAGETWHYRATNVPDFAFFTSDHYIWEMSSIPVADRRVLIHTLYPENNAEAYAKVSKIQQEAMTFFSEKVSGIPYPYPSYASINTYGGGGMEFPMLANNAAPAQEEAMASLTAHEMHHMYFPFYVRTNEKLYAWMDEGWADYITDLALGVDGLYGAEYAEQATGRVNSILRNLLNSGSRVPLMTPSLSTSGDNYFYLTYMYAHLSYMTLHELLGDEVFVEAFREYIRRWAYKSPTPYDFFNTFEDVAGEDLDWFWEPWYFSFGVPDLALGALADGVVTVTRKGELPVGVQVDITYEDGSTESIRESPAVWKDGTTDIELEVNTGKAIQRAVLNANILDVDPSDNVALSEAAVADLGDLGRFAGAYAVNPSLNLQIESSGDRLVLSVDRMDFEATLYPEGENTFASADGSVRVTFRGDGQGGIGFLTANFFGDEVDARKLP